MLIREIEEPVAAKFIPGRSKGKRDVPATCAAPA
jgi:hypothetical protein